MVTRNRLVFNSLNLLLFSFTWLSPLTGLEIVHAKAEAPVFKPEPTTVPVKVIFEPPQAVAAGIDVTLTGPALITTRVTASSQIWQLAPGDWKMAAKARLFKPSQVSLLVESPRASFSVRLRPAPWQPASIVLTSLAGASLVAGSIFTGIYGTRFDHHLTTFLNATPLPNEDGKADVQASAGAMHAMRYDYINYNRGATVLGTSFGFGVGVMTNLFEHRLDHPGYVWLAETISGAGLAVLSFGIAWTFPKFAYRKAIDARFCDSPAFETSEPLFCQPEIRKRDSTLLRSPKSYLHQAATANFFAGFGVGVFVSGIVGLVELAIQTRKPGKRTAISGNGGQLTLSF